MTGAHDVVGGFRNRAEGRQAFVLPDRRQLVSTTGQDLVGVGLVANVPENLVPGRIENAVESHRDLAGAEIGPEVSPDLPDDLDDVGPDLVGELLELLIGQATKVFRSFDLGKEGPDGWVVLVVHLSRS